MHKLEDYRRNRRMKMVVAIAGRLVVNSLFSVR